MKNMLKIRTLKTENRSYGLVTDERHPRFTFSLESDKNGTELSSAVFKLGRWEYKTEEFQSIYDGPDLLPRTPYTVSVNAIDNHGESAGGSMTFETGKLDEPWAGAWITHPSFHFTERRVSPRPMRFRKKFTTDGEIVRARLYCTALGIYVCSLNGERVGENYLTPGFTSYHHEIQYETYDITDMLAIENTLTATVSGGWAVGSYTYFRRNRVYAPRQAFLAEIHILYKDGHEETVATDESWETTMHTPLLSADLYDGEVYDARIEDSEWTGASREKLKFTPLILAEYGEPVRVYERREPISVTRAPSGEFIYDFGQNFAGVVHMHMRGSRGQKVTLRHAEVLMDGELFTEPLRSAKQEIVYTCAGGEEIYTPEFTYMGFRYVGMSGIDPDEIKLTALLLSSDTAVTGTFECSDKRLDRLDRNVYYGARSNFMDIPTDCPQRDERLGWTGDIALFASTASTHFNMSRFFDKWLRDLRAEQGPGGGLPMIVPSVKIYNQIEMCIPHAVDHWGDVCILVPWAEYLARGDLRILRRNYPMMRKYIKACMNWAGLFSIGKRRYIWKLLHHYGDWCAPDTGFKGWMDRGQWTATACLAYSARIMSRIASLLGETRDAKKYAEYSKSAAAAYRDIFMDGSLRLHEEFQTAYVLPLYYELLDADARKIVAGYLAELVEKQGISTGFPGTPYLLFALLDNDQKESAWRTLLSEKCPSWLYEVKAGGTTFWERWDALREDGTCNQGEGGGMVSFNHFAPGAVSDFLYRRIAGIESMEGGYRMFRIKPEPGGDLVFAKGEVETPYGKIVSRWIIDDHVFKISVAVPIGTQCELILPNDETHELESGNYYYECLMEK